MKVKVNEEARKRTNIFTEDLLVGKVYDVIRSEPFLGGTWYRIVDEDREDYLYPDSLFDIVED